MITDLIFAFAMILRTFPARDLFRRWFVDNDLVINASSLYYWCVPVPAPLAAEKMRSDCEMRRDGMEHRGFIQHSPKFSTAFTSSQQKNRWETEKTRYGKCNIMQQQLRVYEQPQCNHINAISTIWSCITTTTTISIDICCQSISWNYGIKFETSDVCTVLWDKLSIKVAKCAWYLKDIALSRSLLLIEKSK